MRAVSSGPARAALVYVIAIGLAVLIAAFARRIGGVGALVTMLTPAVAVVLVMLTTGEARSRSAWRALGLARLGLRGWPLAILVPALVLLASYAAIWALGLGALMPPAFTRSLPATIVHTAIGFVIGMVLAMGEEVGWRGYMLPHLVAIGPLRAMLLVGLLHGTWHLPLILMTPYYHHDGNPFVVVPLFLVALTLAGVFYGWLRLTTGSVWPVAVAHAVFNDVLDALDGATVANVPGALEYVGGESGVLVIAGLVAIAVFVARRIRTGEVGGKGVPLTPRPTAPR